jgi:hypothetical protein
MKIGINIWIIPDNVYNYVAVKEKLEQENFVIVDDEAII